MYLFREKQSREQLLERVRTSGFDTIILTVDTVVAGSRLRDVRNGLTIPPQLSWRTLGEMSRHPRWWTNALTTPPLEFASLRSTDGTVADLINNVFDPSLSRDDLRWLRNAWPGKLLVKGVQHVDDAVLVLDEGADGVILSNHGGRQLDGVPAGAVALAAVADAVQGAVPLLVDGGVRRGTDAIRARALGADAVLVGRPILYGLATAGAEGVAGVLGLLRAELENGLALVGSARFDEVDASVLRHDG